MKFVYPVFIVDTKDSAETDSASRHPFLVCVPDLDILTEGNNMADAIKMARDAIALTLVSMEDAGEELPVSSDYATAAKKAAAYDGEVLFSKGIATYVDADTTEYRRKTDTRTVRRNVTLPSWLNYEAEHSGINVSKVLQDALIQVLGVTRKV